MRYPHPPLPTLKWNPGRGGSWLRSLPITQLHCLCLSSPQLALPSYHTLNHWFKPWLSISWGFAFTFTVLSVPRKPHSTWGMQSAFKLLGQLPPHAGWIAKQLCVVRFAQHHVNNGSNQCLHPRQACAPPSRASQALLQHARAGRCAIQHTHNISKIKKLLLHHSCYLMYPVHQLLGQKILSIANSPSAFRTKLHQKDLTVQLFAN